MHLKIIGWTCEFPAAAFSRIQIDATPTYAVWMLDGGTIRPKVEAEYTGGHPTALLFLPGVFRVCSAAFQRLQIDATPTYAVFMMDAGRIRRELFAIPRWMLPADPWCRFGQRGFWLRPNKFL